MGPTVSKNNYLGKIKVFCGSRYGLPLSVCVMVLVGIELIFFIVLHVMPCFGFVTKTVSIKHWYLTYCWAVLTQCLTTSSASRLEVHKKLGWDIAETADPNWWKGYSIPYDVMLSNKGWGKAGEKRGLSELWCLPSQETVTWWSPTRFEITKHYLPIGISEWIPCFTLFAHATFALQIELLLSQPTVFHTFILLILSLIVLRGKWESGCLVLATSLSHSSMNTFLPCGPKLRVSNTSCFFLLFLFYFLNAILNPFVSSFLKL